MPRILAMLNRSQGPATFFMTGVDGTLHPEMLAAILRSGRNEVGGRMEDPPRFGGEAEGERLP